MNRYYVAVRSTPSGAYRWGRPVYVAVVDGEQVAQGAPIRAAGIVRQWGARGHAEQGRRLDSRYSGPRSAYGRALAEAHRLCSELNAQG